MKKIIIFTALFFVCFVMFAEIIGEITEVKEVAAGIINVKVEYKDGEKLIEERTYTIADSDTAIAAFQNEALPAELQKVKEKVNAEPEPEPVKPAAKVYDIKVGDKIEEL